MQCVQELPLLRTLCKRRRDVRRLQTVIARMRGACISPLKMAGFYPVSNDATALARVASHYKHCFPS
jgi:hypothetical protein